jgi:hypothetical protein
VALGEGHGLGCHLLKRVAGASFCPRFLYSEDYLADVPTRPDKVDQQEQIDRHNVSFRILSGSHTYVNSVTDQPLISCRDMVALDTCMELDRAKRHWNRWTHRGTMVSRTDEEIVAEACVEDYSPISSKEKHLGRGKRSR